MEAHIIDDNRLLTAAEVSRLIKRSVHTLAHDRARRRGIPFVKLGRSVRYHYKDVRDYLRETRRETMVF